ncbi:MAG: threonine synthase [Rhodothermia bacterium]|nr:threonine synthase [Rhodothermia bacterium]
MKTDLSREKLRSRTPDLWRYRELLPLTALSTRVSLNESLSPLVACEELARTTKIRKLFIKDESVLPTGSFKSRGMAVALSMAREAEITKAAMPTAGNAGSAFAAYAREAGIDAYVFMPADAPHWNQQDVMESGGRLFLVDGLITDCGRIVAEGEAHIAWFNMATLREPYRLEGKKTMGLELAEQLGWTLPDVIIYPTGGGTGLIGMWKAFEEMDALGWIPQGQRPRMVAVQSAGCCPIVRAWESRSDFCAPFDNAHTMASGLRVPYTAGDFLILDILRRSNGAAVAVEERLIPSWMTLGQTTTGLSIGPESATCIGALIRLRETGWLKADERVVIFNCGADRSKSNPDPINVPIIDPNRAIDWDRLLNR